MLVNVEWRLHQAIISLVAITQANGREAAAKRLIAVSVRQSVIGEVAGVK